MNSLQMSITRGALAIGLVCAAIVSGGCSEDDPERFRPAAQVASEALAAALERRVVGDGTPVTLDGDVRVELIDKHRPIGQRLSEFRILGEVSGAGGRWFEVELTLRNPDEVARDRYVVVGINPLWAFRQQDYEMLQHWDHPMPEEPTGLPEKAPDDSDSSSDGAKK